jgi:hypothetical protein
MADPHDLSGADWGYHYPVDLVSLGAMLYRGSGFAHIPDPRELGSLDPNWIRDLNQRLRFEDYWIENG